MHAVRRHAADHARRGRDLPPRLVARQQRRDPRSRLHADAARRGRGANAGVDRGGRRDRDRRHGSHSENARQWVHIGSGLFALLLRVLNGWQAAALAAAALVFNLVLLPRVGGRQLYRPVDHARGFPLGILLYPLSVLLLTLAFPSRLDIAAAAWGILAFGDGFATLIGRSRTKEPQRPQSTQRKRSLCELSDSAVPSGRFPWNPDKSIAGTLAFIVFGSVGRRRARVVGAAGDRRRCRRWRSRSPRRWRRRCSRRWSRRFRSGSTTTSRCRRPRRRVLWIASLMTRRRRWRGARPRCVARAAVGDRRQRARPAGSATAPGRSRSRARSRGALVGAIIYVGGGAGAWVLLLVTFLAASVTSRLGLARKERLGIAEERGGRRGAGNAIANCGVAAMAAIAAVTTPYPAAALAARWSPR